MVKALFYSTYSTSIVEEEPRAVFLHLFRGVVFLSFSAFSGRWFELFTVTFRRVQRFYVCKRRLRGQPQLSIMGQEYHLILTQSVCEVVTVQYPYAIVPTLVLYSLISISFSPGAPFLERIEEEPHAVFLHFFVGLFFFPFQHFRVGGLSFPQ